LVSIWHISLGFSHFCALEIFGTERNGIISNCMSEMSLRTKQK
jgi:hypothetical protein